MSGDPDDPKPEVRALVAYPLMRGDVALSTMNAEQGFTVTLEEAEQFHRLGWIVLIDPAHESELARWEQRRRAMNRRWNW